MHADVAYFLAVLFHAMAIFVGLYVIHKHEDLFKNSCPRSIFRSRTEFHFWILIASIAVNTIWLLIIVPRFAMHKQILSNDFIFVLAHVGMGIVMSAWHIDALMELNRKKGVGSSA